MIKMEGQIWNGESQLRKVTVVHADSSLVLPARERSIPLCFSMVHWGESTVRFGQVAKYFSFEIFE